MMYFLCFVAGIGTTLLVSWACGKLIAWQERENERQAMEALEKDLNHLFEENE